MHGAPCNNMYECPIELMLCIDESIYSGFYVNGLYVLESDLRGVLSSDLKQHIAACITPFAWVGTCAADPQRARSM